MQPQRLRRLAVHVLLAWLFAFGTGIVNACVVNLELRNSAPAAVQAEEAQATALSHTTADGPCVHDHESDHSTLPCERFCEEPGAVNQAAKQQGDITSGWWLVSLPVPSFIFQPLSTADGALGAQPARWRAAVPISIAFLRLTL